MPTVTQLSTPLQVILNNPILAQLKAEALQQQKDLRQVRKHLPTAWQQRCTAAHVAGETLVLFVAEAAWAARLRYQAAQLCQAVSTPERQVRYLRVRITPAPTGPSKPAAPARPRLSAQQLDQWRSLVGLPPKHRS